MNPPAAASPAYALAPGVVALPHGLVWMERSRALVVADAHLAYEEVIGGALPLWSTAEALALLLRGVERQRARELIFLGDIIHGSRMSEGAAGVVSSALAQLRERCTVTLVAGNHEGHTRGAAVLGATEVAVERDGWRLVHGDDPTEIASRRIVGHLHPALALGGGKSAPVFLASERLIVAPALTPYSSGLNVLSRECAQALRGFGCVPREFTLVASGDTCVYPFGSLSALNGATTRRGATSRYARKHLQAD